MIVTGIVIVLILLLALFVYVMGRILTSESPATLGYAVFGEPKYCDDHQTELPCEPCKSDDFMFEDPQKENFRQVEVMKIHVWYDSLDDVIFESVIGIEDVHSSINRTELVYLGEL